MRGIARLLQVLSVALFFSILWAESARAICFSSADCPAGLTCRGGPGHPRVPRDCLQF